MFFFSIIIPVYNRAHRLPYVLESLKRQIFQNFETIIVDDASTDDSYFVALEYELHDKIVLRNEVNRERCVTRNKGIDIAKGKYICFLDSDDYHLPNHLQELYDAINEKNSPIAFFYTNSYNETETGIRTKHCCPIFSKYNSYTYFLRYTVNPQRWAIHRDILQKIQFDENVIIAEDMDLSLRILVAGYPIYQLNKYTTVYVAATDSFTLSDNCKTEKELMYYKRIFSKQELKHYLPKKEKNRLFSKCYFYLMQKSFEKRERWNTIKYGCYSFLLCNKGYNGATNRIVFVSCLYSIPILGNIIQHIKNEIHYHHSNI